MLVTGPHAWPPVDAVLALAGLGALCTALAFVLFFRLIVEVGAARSTLVAYLNPVVAVTLGALVLDEADHDHGARGDGPDPRSVRRRPRAGHATPTTPHRSRPRRRTADEVRVTPT